MGDISKRLFGEAEKIDQFGAEDWLLIEAALDELKAAGVIQTDVSPANISL
jgi:hypothetical protein